jgi:hypothetical protein
MDKKNKKDDWMQTKWRPMMGWTYMATCIADFVVFPVLWSVLQALQGGQVTSQWNPITLQGAGLFHLAMGAVLGVAAWSRGQEKMSGAASNSMMPGMMPMGGNSYNTNYEQTYEYTSQTPIQTGRTFTSKHGKVGPVIEEPEL